MRKTAVHRPPRAKLQATRLKWADGGDEASSTNEETSAKAANELTSEKIQVAAASALAAAAVKAKHLANVEERRMKSLVAQLVETQMKKLEAKLRHFDELEIITDRERESFEYQRQQLILERQFFHLDQLRYMQQRSKTDATNAMIQRGELDAAFEVRGFPPQMQPVPQIPTSATPPQQQQPTQTSAPARADTAEPQPPQTAGEQPRASSAAASAAEKDAAAATRAASAEQKPVDVAAQQQQLPPQQPPPPQVKQPATVAEQIATPASAAAMPPTILTAPQSAPVVQPTPTHQPPGSVPMSIAASASHSVRRLF